MPANAARVLAINRRSHRRQYPTICSLMLDPVRQEVATTSRTVVVKVGTRVLTHEDGTLDHDRVTAIAEQLVRLIDDQRQVVLVSSGAVGAGIGRLGLRQRPTDLAHLQAVAAVGQSRLSKRTTGPWKPTAGTRPKSCSRPTTSTTARVISTSATRCWRCFSIGRCRSSTRTTRCGSTSCSAASATTTGWRRW